MLIFQVKYNEAEEVHKTNVSIVSIRLGTVGDVVKSKFVKENPEAKQQIEDIQKRYDLIKKQVTDKGTDFKEFTDFKLKLDVMFTKRKMAPEEMIAELPKLKEKLVLLEAAVGVKQQAPITDNTTTSSTIMKVNQVWPIDKLNLRDFLKETVAPLVPEDNEVMQAVLEKPNTQLTKTLAILKNLGLIEGENWTDESTLQKIIDDPKKMALVKIALLLGTVRSLSHMEDNISKFVIKNDDGTVNQAASVENILYNARVIDHNTEICGLAGGMVNYINYKSGKPVPVEKQTSITNGAMIWWSRQLDPIVKDIQIDLSLINKTDTQLTTTNFDAIKTSPMVQIAGQVLISAEFSNEPGLKQAMEEKNAQNREPSKTSGNTTTYNPEEILKVAGDNVTPTEVPGKDYTVQKDAVNTIVEIEAGPSKNKTLQKKMQSLNLIDGDGKLTNEGKNYLMSDKQSDFRKAERAIRKGDVDSGYVQTMLAQKLKNSLTEMELLDSNGKANEISWVGKGLNLGLKMIDDVKTEGYSALSTFREYVTRETSLDGKQGYVGGVPKGVATTTIMKKVKDAAESVSSTAKETVFGSVYDAIAYDFAKKKDAGAQPLFEYIESKNSSPMPAMGLLNKVQEKLTADKKSITIENIKAEIDVQLGLVKQVKKVEKEENKNETQKKDEIKKEQNKDDNKLTEIKENKKETKQEKKAAKKKAKEDIKAAKKQEEEKRQMEKEAKEKLEKELKEKQKEQQKSKEKQEQKKEVTEEKKKEKKEETQDLSQNQKKLSNFLKGYDKTEANQLKEALGMPKEKGIEELANKKEVADNFAELFGNYKDTDALKEKILAKAPDIKLNPASDEKLEGYEKKFMFLMKAVEVDVKAEEEAKKNIVKIDDFLSMFKPEQKEKIMKILDITDEKKFVDLAKKQSIVDAYEQLAKYDAKQAIKTIMEVAEDSNYKWDNFKDGDEKAYVYKFKSMIESAATVLETRQAAKNE